jgi:hypothetical protein
VLQVLPLLVNVAGTVMPVGTVIVVVIGPVAGAEPTFVTVTGTLLVVPTTNGVEGCPIVVTKSGTPVTAVLGVIGAAGLFPVFAAGSFGADVVAVVCGVVPTIAAVGVIGT